MKKAKELKTASGKKPVNMSPLELLLEEARGLGLCLRAVMARIHDQDEMPMGERLVLRRLNRFGPQTVPQMARRGMVSRQHIQALVNPLVKAGHIELIDNPAHKKSRLARITDRGKKIVAGMQRRESDLISQLKINRSADELRNASEVLRSARELFESEQWKRLLDD